MNSAEGLDAILPAAGRLAGGFAAEAGATIKALIRFDGETLLERTIRAARESGVVRRIAVIGPEEVWEQAQAAGADAVLPELADGPDNVLSGLSWLRERSADARRALVLTTDLPFITGRAIADYVAACPPDGQIAVSAVPAESFESRFPGAPAIYVNLGDGRWTMGCGFVVDPAALLDNEARLRSIFDARKSQVGMARLLGARFVWRWLTRRLTVDEIAARCSDLLGVRGAVVRNGPPELAYDIDDPADLRYAVQALEEGK